MFLHHLDLTNFRNYRRLDLEVPAGLVVFFGDNGQGKSNLLEAIYLLATTKSPRAGTERELINRQALESEFPFARVVGQVRKESGLLEVEMVVQTRAGNASDLSFGGPEESTLQALMSNAGKRIKVNGVARRAVDVVGQVNVVLFSTQDIEIMGGSPSLRRHYLDVTISQTDRRYLKTLQQYNKVLLQRNHLLKLIQERQATSDQLPFWDDKLVEAGAYLQTERRKTVTSLDMLAPPIHGQLTDGREKLHIIYVESVQGDPEEFRQLLSRMQDREIARGMSLVGPHRDDLRFMTDGTDVGIYGSRGQQRTVTLSLHLAEGQLMKEKTGEEAIILLDDVLSELDERRRAHLLESILSYQQVILTTTDPAAIPDHSLQSASVFKVTAGEIAGD